MSNEKLQGIFDYYNQYDLSGLPRDRLIELADSVYEKLSEYMSNPDFKSTGDIVNAHRQQMWIKLVNFIGMIYQKTGMLKNRAREMSLLTE